MPVDEFIDITSTLMVDARQTSKIFQNILYQATRTFYKKFRREYHTAELFCKILPRIS